MNSSELWQPEWKKHPMSHVPGVPSLQSGTPSVSPRGELSPRFRREDISTLAALDSPRRIPAVNSAPLGVPIQQSSSDLNSRSFGESRSDEERPKIHLVTAAFQRSPLALSPAPLSLNVARVSSDDGLTVGTVLDAGDLSTQIKAQEDLIEDGEEEEEEQEEELSEAIPAFPSARRTVQPVEENSGEEDEPEQWAVKAPVWASDASTTVGMETARSMWSPRSEHIGSPRARLVLPPVPEQGEVPPPPLHSPRFAQRPNPYSLPVASHHALSLNTPGGFPHTLPVEAHTLPVETNPLMSQRAGTETRISPTSVPKSVREVVRHRTATAGYPRINAPIALPSTFELPQQPEQATLARDDVSRHSVMSPRPTARATVGGIGWVTGQSFLPNRSSTVSRTVTLPVAQTRSSQTLGPLGFSSPRVTRVTPSPTATPPPPPRRLQPTPSEMSQKMTLLSRSNTLPSSFSTAASSPWFRVLPSSGGSSLSVHPSMGVSPGPLVVPRHQPGVSKPPTKPELTPKVNESTKLTALLPIDPGHSSRVLTSKRKRKASARRALITRQTIMAPAEHSTIIAPQSRDAFSAVSISTSLAEPKSPRESDLFAGLKKLFPCDCCSPRRKK
eukprot:Protomagalhaensia_sp_Gyna_25__739@NODE_1351_length_1917_cov_19_663472_g1083_i0_p1_GENE_NODE_1351_length_1917_cov_19_663472_g1083_i0NODE_1351_length_1917_cov_19_663472_g1083_i0_p1_ORF_typecomplete_len615_score85_32_NODE_1351_length_1917_cov_19_663472_g1083_i0451889